MFYRVLLTLLIVFHATLSAWANPPPSPPLPQDSYSATILAYHHIGEDSTPHSSLRIEQFNEHLNEIISGEYNVIALPDLIEAFNSNQELPPRTIVITFEGGFRSAYENAMPALIKQNIPFTIFFSSSMTDRSAYLDWQTLKRLSRNKNITLGILPHNYTHTVDLSTADQRHQINKARSLFREKIGHEARYFSYPFGEISTDLKSALKQQSFDAAFGLHSGTAYKGHDMLTLPRFTMTEQYGDLQRFRLVTNALPFPIVDSEPEDPMIISENPAIGFTLPNTLNDQKKDLSCFISGHQEQPDIQTLGNRIELRPKEPLTTERTRINCTLPGSKDVNDTPRWRWFGMLLHSTTEINQKQGGPQRPQAQNASTYPQSPTSMSQ